MKPIVNPTIKSYEYEANQLITIASLLEAGNIKGAALVVALMESQGNITDAAWRSLNLFTSLESGRLGCSECGGEPLTASEIAAGLRGRASRIIVDGRSGELWDEAPSAAEDYADAVLAQYDDSPSYPDIDERWEPDDF